VQAHFVMLRWLTRKLASLLPASRRVRIVRRAKLTCPHLCELVEVDVLTGSDAGCRPVLRCSAHLDCPPSCDHACRRLPEALGETPGTQIFLPPGTELPREID
jgi:hypothetical protein